MTPRIAVVIPNRNDSRYLARCLRSVLEQDDPPDEVVVIDDQSSDASVPLIRSLIAPHARARLIENPVNLGTYGAVDKGLEGVTSEYVLFLSANDFVLPGLFARARACLAQHPGVGLWSAMGWLVDEDDRVVRLHLSPVVALRDAYLPPDECVRLAYRVGNWFVGSTVVYHRETLEAAKRFEPEYMGLADLVAAWRVSAARGAVYSPRPFGANRLHGTSNLSKTLTVSANLEGILERLAGTGLAPAFFDRLALRLRFATVRATRGASLPAVAAKYAGLRGFVLRAVDLLPAPARVVFAYPALCWFDLWPTFWNRLFGSVAVRLLLRLRGERSHVPAAAPRA
jgi:glycosyltransferase involved in cell wall biosynthesis